MPVSCARQGGERTARYGTCARRAGIRRASEVPNLARGSVLVRPRQRRSTRVPAAQRHDSILLVADFFAGLNPSPSQTRTRRPMSAGRLSARSLALWRAMGRERPGRGEGGRRTAVRYVWGAKKAVISSISCTFMLGGAARGSGQQKAKSLKKARIRRGLFKPTTGRLWQSDRVVKTDAEGKKAPEAPS